MKSIVSLSVFLFVVQLHAGLGDLNNDGTITLNDCKLLAAAVAAGTTPDAAIADIDGDGSVTIVDAMRLHQSIGGLWIEPTGTIEPVPVLSPEERTYLAQYEEYCDRYETMSPEGFIAGFSPAPSYTSTLDPQQCRYYTQIDSVFQLTDEQKQVLENEGMVVLKNSATGRGFGAHYTDIYRADLPVFFTSDALLDPLYQLYDDVLSEIETIALLPIIESVIDAALSQCTQMQTSRSVDDAWIQAIDDARIYLLVAKGLLSGEQNSVTNPVAADFLTHINNEALVNDVPFFGEIRKSIDFSQFKPRGHYECTESAQETNGCALSRYFRCMMWFGRADCAFNIDSLRQLRAFALIHAAMEQAQVLGDLSWFNQTISLFVGDVDGFTLEGFSTIQKRMHFSIDSIILSDNTARQVLSSIAAAGEGNQLIMSQALWKDPGNTRPEIPKIAQICGQRFILDSYLLGRTVEWYVQNRNKPLLEEIAFYLGNNAAIPVAASDITTYTASGGDYKPYHARLGAGRVLVEKYPYYDRNIYTLWFDALRSLSTPLNLNVPMVMNSRSWQDKQMNTQLASWAQLRHNTILYAKQSYTGGVICFYPDGYVEPYPDFYRSIGKIMERLQTFGREIGTHVQVPQGGLTFLYHLSPWIAVTDSLAAIAETELTGEPLSEQQLAFLNRMINTNPDPMCGAPPLIGWYLNLFKKESHWKQSRPSIADVHTIPPSDVKPDNMVLHAASGNPSKIIIQAATGNSCGTLYVGVVSSFYQHDETPIARLTDSNWKTVLNGGTEKPNVPEWFAKYQK